MARAVLVVSRYGDPPNRLDAFRDTLYRTLGGVDAATPPAGLEPVVNA